MEALFLMQSFTAHHVPRLAEQKTPVIAYLPSTGITGAHQQPWLSYMDSGGS